MFKENGACDGVVEGVVGFAARTECTDSFFELKPSD